MAAMADIDGRDQAGRGSHKIQGAAKEREEVGVGTRSRSQQNMIDVF